MKKTKSIILTYPIITIKHGSFNPFEEISPKSKNK